MSRFYSSRYLWAAMAHLTPTTFDVILSPNGGLAKLSDKIARNVSRTDCSYKVLGL